MIRIKRLFCVLILCTVFSTSEAQTIAAQPTIKDQFTKKIGNLRLSLSTLAFGSVTNNEVKRDTIRIMNIGKSPINLSVQTKTGYSHVVLSSPKLSPEEVGWISITYDFSKRDEYGFILDRILINTDDSELPQKNINITATIREYFPPTTDSLSPKARVPESLYSYGTIRAGEKAGHDFLVYNDGTKPLIIRKVKSTCGCIKSSVTKSEIAPGEAGIIHIDFDSFGKEGKDSRVINVYLNDPLLPEIKLEINGVVVR